MLAMAIRQAYFVKTQLSKIYDKVCPLPMPPLPLLQTGINSNTSMHKWSHAQ